MCDEFCQSLTLLPRGSEPWIWISKPSKSRVKKFIRGRSLPTAALSVKGPAKNEFRRTIMFSSHSSEPMVNESGLPDARPGHDGNDIDLRLLPSSVQESDVVLSTKNLASCNGQSGHRNFRRSQSSRRPASSDARSGRERLVEDVTSDSTSYVDSACYRRYRLQKFGRALETPGWVFLSRTSRRTTTGCGACSSSSSGNGAC